LSRLDDKMAESIATGAELWFEKPYPLAIGCACAEKPAPTRVLDRRSGCACASRVATRCRFRASSFEGELLTMLGLKRLSAFKIIL